VAGLVHKTDAGAVHVDLRSDEEVRAAFRALQHVSAPRLGLPLTTVLVQEYVKGGVEVIVGWAHDPDMGLFILCGSGGVFAELHGDVAVRFLPVRSAEIEEMVAELACARILRGYRGGPPADVAALGDALERLGVMAAELGDTIEAVEVNPLLVLAHGAGVKAIDATVVLPASAGSRHASDAVAAENL
jgi:acyl-CoA synthetase (NDP forming)